MYEGQKGFTLFSFDRVTQRNHALWYGVGCKILLFGEIVMSIVCVRNFL